ncbi:restriction endonuclease subunit S [Mesorhizobium sp. M0106]|uniref:restriction endonuclease subunit S n=1 Tax=Mesorhizobium sp. M0106 TaxID=2956880 RepID=UPI003335F5A5
MSGWTSTTLGDLIEVKHGFAFKGEYFRDAPPGDILLTPGNFAVGGGFQFGKLKFYDGPSAPGYVLRAGDLLVTMTDLSKAGDTLGYPAIVPHDGSVYLHNQRLGKVDCTSDLASRDFIYWLMRTSSYRAEVLASCTGSTVKHTSPSRIKAYRFLLPPQPEQKLICEVLGALDAKIEVNRRMNETLETMAQAIFRDWYVNFGPTRRKIDGATDPVDIVGCLVTDPDEAQELANLFPEALGDDGLPSGWSTSPLASILSVLETGSRPKGGVKGINFGIPSIGAESIVGIGKYDFSKTKYVSVEFHKGMKRGYVSDRDVLLYKDGGRPGEFEPHVSMFGSGFPFSEFCINEHVYRIRACPPFTQEFLYFMLTSEALMDEMRNRGTGVATPGLNSTAVKALPFVDAGHEIAAAFGSLVHPLVSRILANGAQSRTLAATRDLLLPKFISGEITIRDAERRLEAAQ